MDPTAGAGAGMFPHIPDEWNRESTKTIMKQPASKNIQRADTVHTTEKAVETATPAAAKKRKRAPAVSVNTNTIAETSATTKINSDVQMNTTDTTTPVEPDNAASIPTLAQFESPDTTAQTMPGQSSAVARRQCDETESVMRGLYHQVEKLARRPGCALEEGIYLDSIMTHIPYVEVLQQMFGGSEVADSACVPVVTRAYEESYMREVLSGVDEPCIMGSNCECQFIDEHNPFTGVQFTLPVEAFSSAATAAGMVKELSSNKLCVLCCRKHTQSLFYEALYNHRAYSACIQLYGNICDRPGEYAKEAMLICPLSGPINNMPLPVVAHQRNRYSVVVHNGVRQLRQHRVAYEDFHVPSSSRC
jgi:hypothetical protein